MDDPRFDLDYEQLEDEVGIDSGPDYDIDDLNENQRSLPPSKIENIKSYRFARPGEPWFDEDGVQRCGGCTDEMTPCMNYPSKGSNRCRKHGGEALWGPMSPMYKTGRYSKFIPPRLSERYNDLLADPDILDMSDNIRLLDTRIADLLERVDFGDSEEYLRDLTDEFRQMKLFLLRGDPDEARVHMELMEELLEKRQSDFSAWRQLLAVMDERRKVTEAERKRLKDMNQIITVEEVMIIIGNLLSIMNEHIEDTHVKSKIAREIRGLITY